MRPIWILHFELGILVTREWGSINSNCFKDLPTEAIVEKLLFVESDISGSSLSFSLNCSSKQRLRGSKPRLGSQNCRCLEHLPE